MPTVLAEISPYDPVAEAAVTLRASTDDDSRVCALNGVGWWPVLMKAGKASATSFDASFPGFASTPTDKIEIDLSVFPDAARYSWGDRPVKLWMGEPGQAWPWTQDFQGLVAAAAIKDGRITLTIRPDDAWLDRPVLATYAGTGGLEGPASLAGTPKPLALGQPKYVAPVQIDTVYNVWQYHGYGPVPAPIAALDRLVRYPAVLGNDASLAALIAATIPPGSLRTCTEQGLVRYGAPPAGPMTLIVNGGLWDAAQPRRAGALIRRVALLAGATADQIDAASLAALDAAAPYELSFYQTAQISAREFIARIAASVNGLARISLLGKLEVILPEIGAPLMTLAADGSAEPQVLPLELLESGAPTWKSQMAGNPCWRVHGDGEYYDPQAGSAEAQAAADNAQAAADNAQAAADNAQATADAAQANAEIRMRVFYQEEPPEAPPAVEGNTWLKPSTRVWSRYSAALGWQPVLGAFAAANIIDNSNIAMLLAAAVIGDAYITDLNAAKITAGVINTSRLNLDGITLSNVGGELVISNGGVDTAQLAPNAAVILATYDQVGTSVLTGSYATIVLAGLVAQVTLTNSTLYAATITFAITANAYQAGSDSDSANFRLMDGVTLVGARTGIDVSGNSSRATTVSLQWTVTIPASTTKTYTLQASSNDSTTIRAVVIHATMFKRV